MIVIFTLTLSSGSILVVLGLGHMLFFHGNKVLTQKFVFSDPMMMALGAMVTMAGAYMAIVMQETAAANAFAIAAASGKKKKK